MSTESSESGCRWCGEERVSASLSADERQFPGDVPFSQSYTICANCGSLSASVSIDDVSPHYPSSYYAYRKAHDNRLVRWMRGTRARSLTLRPSLAGRLIAYRTGTPADLAAFARLTTVSTSRILDVGAGVGRLLRDLSYAGYSELVGVDPFGPVDDGPPRLMRNHVRALQDDWDVIMYHHCLEHVECPADEMDAAARRLREGGKLLIRIPLVDSDAFAQYGARWVQLDAPRHRAIPTTRGMALLAARTGLRIVDAWRDSSAFQFWGSELYLRDIPLQSARASPEIIFGKAQLSAWERRAKELNAQNRGDQGAFVLETLS